MTDYEIAKLLLDPRRREILEIAAEQPVTVTQIAERLNEAPSRLYYHVKKLEEANMLELVETKPNGNLLEKYYKSVPLKNRSFEIDPAVLMRHADEFQKHIMDVLQPGLQKLSESIRKGANPDDADVHLAISFKKFTPIEWKEYCEANGMTKEKSEETAGDGNGKKEKYAVFTLAYKLDDSAKTE